jgi:pyruvate dehydrogenase E1 component beta subunit
MTKGTDIYSEYHKSICDEMKRLAENPKVMFIGQQIASEDFYHTLTDIPMNRRTEFPVAEEMQLGVSIGLALEGWFPVSIYQRMDFLPRAMDQLVNHLNLIPEISRGRFKPKILIRTTIGTKKPFDVGLQHSQDLTEMLKIVLKFPVIKVSTPKEVKLAYGLARELDSPMLIVEKQELYNE